MRSVIMKLRNTNNILVRFLGVHRACEGWWFVVVHITVAINMFELGRAGLVYVLYHNIEYATCGITIPCEIIIYIAQYLQLCIAEIRKYYIDEE